MVGTWEVRVRWTPFARRFRGGIGFNFFLVGFRS